jgi:hypothetical protein
MDVIVAAGSVAVIRAAKQATSTIPIVMALGIDPVGQGFISSIHRPGGNITGVSWDPDPAIYGKYPELLKDMIQSSRGWAPSGIPASHTSTARPLTTPRRVWACRVPRRRRYVSVASSGNAVW